MNGIVVYGPDGRTRIDIKTLPFADQCDILNFHARFKNSPLVTGKGVAPREPEVPDWAKPIPAKVAPAPAESMPDPQLSMLDLEPLEPGPRRARNAQRRVRSIAE